MSEEEYLRIPETTDRIELIDGEVVVSPSPSFEHQSLSMRLSRVLDAWCDAHPPAIALCAPLDIRLRPGRIVQPDLVLWVDGVPDRTMPLGVMPQLVVEILSTRPEFDRLGKRVLYAEAGIPEYWMVDPTTKTLEIALGLQSLGVVDRWTSTVAPGLVVEAAPLFR